MKDRQFGQAAAMESPGNMKGLAAAGAVFDAGQGQAGRGAAEKASRGRGRGSKIYPVMFARLSPEEMCPADSLKQNFQSSGGHSLGTSQELPWGVSRS